MIRGEQTVRQTYHHLVTEDTSWCLDEVQENYETTLECKRFGGGSTYADVCQDDEALEQSS